MRYVLTIFATIGILWSCESEVSEPSGINQEFTEIFDGAWSYKSRSCECDPIFLNNGDNVWTFNSSINQLQIENNVSSLYPYLDSSGTYDISFTDDSIYFGEFSYQYYLINENLILADYPEADGPLIEFECLSSIPSNNCDSLLTGLLDRNNDLLSTEINNLCVDLEPYSTLSDPLGHQVNLLSLVNRLNNNCPDISCSIACYACIFTEPAISEISFQIDSVGIAVDRIVDITTPANDILNYLSIH